MDSIKLLLNVLSTTTEFFSGILFFYLIRIFFTIDIVAIYGVYLSFLSIFIFITDLGFSTAHLKFFPHTKNLSEKAELNTTFLFLRIIQITIYITVVLSICFYFINSVDFISFSYLFLGEIFRSLSFSTLLFFLYSKKNVSIKLIAISVSSFLRIFLLLLFITIYDKSISILGFLYLISNVIFFLIILIAVKNINLGKLRFDLIKDYLKFSYPFFFITASNIIINNVDILIINIWFSINDVGNYFTAKQIYNFNISIMISFAYILIPIFTSKEKIFSEDNLKIVNYLHKFLNLIFVLISLFCFLYSSKIILILFGSNYNLTSLILFIFSLNLILKSNNFFNLIFLQSLGKTKLVAKFYIIENFLVFIFMIIFLAPNFLNIGPIGVPFSFFLSNLITQIIFRPYFLKKYHLKFNWGIFRNILIMIGITIFHLIMSNIINLNNSYFLLLFLVIDIAFYLGLNIGLKGITKKDLLFIKSIFSLKNIYRTFLSGFNVNYEKNNDDF